MTTPMPYDNASAARVICWIVMNQARLLSEHLLQLDECLVALSHIRNARNQIVDYFLGKWPVLVPVQMTIDCTEIVINACCRRVTSWWLPRGPLVNMHRTYQVLISAVVLAAWRTVRLPSEWDAGQHVAGVYGHFIFSAYAHFPVRLLRDENGYRPFTVVNTSDYT